MRQTINNTMSRDMVICTIGMQLQMEIQVGVRMETLCKVYVLKNGIFPARQNGTPLSIRYRGKLIANAIMKSTKLQRHYHHLLDGLVTVQHVLPVTLITTLPTTINPASLHYQRAQWTIGTAITTDILALGLITGVRHHQLTPVMQGQCL